MIILIFNHLGAIKDGSKQKKVLSAVPAEGRNKISVTQLSEVGRFSLVPFITVKKKHDTFKCELSLIFRV